MRSGVLALALCLAACGNSEPTTTAPAESTAGGDVAEDSCQRYALKLCEALGPRSESCRSALGVVSVMSQRACAVGVEDWQHTLDRISAMQQDCQKLADQVCEAVGDDAEGCVAVRSEVPSIPPGHCTALLREAPQLIARIREREQEALPLDAERWAAVSKTGSPGFGRDDASVVLVAFSDFECPYCAKAAETLNKVKDAYAERVRFVFRHYPLPFHPHAHGAAQAAQAAFEQGKFWEFHDLLFDNQDALEAESLESYAKQIGLDMDKFRAARSSDASASAVARDVELGDSVHVRGTPTLFINGKRVENALDYDEVSSEIDAALE